MTTLELYRKHKAGEISREKFLYEVRRDNNIPWVLNTTSYDDAVTILKNKGIINEVSEEVLEEAKKAKKKKQPKELHIDQANPYEFRHGVQHELAEMDEYTDEALEKAKAKVLKNLGKDPLFYSTLLNQKQSPYKFKAPETDKPGMQAKADGHLKKELKKDEKANVKDTLGKKEEGTKNPKGVKEMTMTPKKAKGIKKTMAMPGKEKTIKLKEHHNDPNFPGGQAIYDLLDTVATDWGKEDLYQELEDVIVAYSDNGRLSNAGLARLKGVLENYDVLDDYQYLLDKIVVKEGLKLMDFFLGEDKAMFMDEPADAEKYQIKKDLKGNIVQATNDEGNTFSKNDEAIAIDNGEKIKIASFKEEQGKVKALFNKGMFFSSIDIDGLKPISKGFRPGVDLGKAFGKLEAMKEYIKSKLKTEDAAKDTQAKQAAIVAAGKELDALRSQMSGLTNDASLNPDEKNKKKAFLQSKINDATKRMSDLKSGKVTYP